MVSYNTNIAVLKSVLNFGKIVLKGVLKKLFWMIVHSKEVRVMDLPTLLILLVKLPACKPDNPRLTSLCQWVDA